MTRSTAGGPHHPLLQATLDGVPGRHCLAVGVPPGTPMEAVMESQTLFHKHSFSSSSPGHAHT